MPSRAELELRARSVGLDPSTYPNDSKLEQKVIYLEKNATTTTGATAAGTLTGTLVPANNDTVTINGVTYTFKTALTNAGATPYEVLINGTLAAALTNLGRAISGTGTPGTDYGSGTPKHPQVNVGTVTGTTVPLTAVDKQVGNSITTTATGGNVTWGSGTLTGGSPAVIAASAPAVAGQSGGANV